MMCANLISLAMLAIGKTWHNDGGGSVLVLKGKEMAFASSEVWERLIYRKVFVLFTLR